MELLYIIIPVIAIMYIFILVFIINGSKTKAKKREDNEPINQKRFTTFYVTKSQFNSVKNQLLKMIYNKDKISEALDGFFCVKDDERKKINYIVVDDDDDRANYKYQIIGKFWQYCEPAGKTRVQFRDNGTRTSKRIIQYLEDEGIEIIRLNKRECFVLLDEDSIHVGYIDYVSRFEASEEINSTFGWEFKCIRKNSRCKNIPSFIVPTQLFKIRPRSNVYCENVCAYRNNWKYEPNYVLPIKNAYARVYTELAAKGSIPVRFKGERELLSLLIKKYPDVIFQYHPDFLKPQSLDFYIPSISTAIEFQGLQHYKPIGDKARLLETFEHQIERDKRKEELCKQNDVKLILWKYDFPVTEENLIKKIRSVAS